MHGMGLVFWHCIKWLRHVVLLISMWYCRSFYKGNSCNHYSYSYVIIWYVKHLCRVQARGTFICLTCQYIYFHLLLLWIFKVVKQCTLSIQLPFLGADERMQKERCSGTVEISTLQDPIQNGLIRINILSTIAITIMTNKSAAPCTAQPFTTAAFTAIICHWLQLQAARIFEQLALCRGVGRTQQKVAGLWTTARHPKRKKAPAPTCANIDLAWPGRLPFK